MCLHKFVDGFGSGDAVVCVKCGLDKYPEALGLFSKLLPVIKNNGTYMHFRKFPYVRKFPRLITFGIDLDVWTHFFDADGTLKSKDVYVES